MSYKKKNNTTYGKSSNDLISHKNVFFKNNNQLLSDGTDLNKIYAQQPKRLNCKNCDHEIHKVSFTKLGVDYLICENCTHLNGANEDTDEFCSHVYTENKGVNYSNLYNSKSANEYVKRVKDIYEPKANFINNYLVNSNLDPMELKFADFGAGSGYLVSALKALKFNNVIGYEVSEHQVLYGNQMMKDNLLHQISLQSTAQKISLVDADIVSMIGVLEHLQNPREILSAISANKNIKFFYISVPLFSISVFFEMIFPTVMNRQLSGAHTHLYTEKSLEYMAKEFKFENVATWWFGTDMVDLYRSVHVLLDKKNDTKSMTHLWSEMFSSIIDPLQLSLDKKHLSSEVHMIFRVH